MRRPRSRWSKRLPVANCLFNWAICSARSFHALWRGERTNLSPANSATIAMATITSSFWRSLICTSASFIPDKIETELQRRLAARRSQVDFADLGSLPQFLHRLQQRLAIPRGARADHRFQLSNLDRLGRHRAVFRKGLGEAAQDRHPARRFIVPVAKLANLALGFLQLDHLVPDLPPLRFEVPKSKLLVKEQPACQHCGRPRDAQGGPKFAGGVARRHLLPGCHFWRQKLEPGLLARQSPRRQA